MLITVSQSPGSFLNIFLFGWINSPEFKDNQFTMIENTEKQQILKGAGKKRLKQTINKTVAN